MNYPNVCMSGGRGTLVVSTPTFHNAHTIFKLVLEVVALISQSSGADGLIAGHEI